MKDYRKIIFVLVVMVFALFMFNMSNDSNEKQNKKPIVSLSTFSLYDISNHISQGTFELVQILPVGENVYSYKPTPELIAKINKSKLVIYNGAGLESWVNEFDFKNRVIDMSKFIKLRELESDEFYMHKYHDEQCVHTKTDPHYWLDIENMKKITNLIAAEFVRIKPENKELYIKNRDSYLSMLNNLDKLYKTQLNKCYLDTIVVNHKSFSYLSSRYGFKAESLKGFSPDSTTNTKDINRIYKIVKEHKLPLIFVEKFANNEDIKLLAKNLNVETDTLQPLSNITNEEHNSSLTYEDIMKINLTKISKALMCE